MLFLAFLNHVFSVIFKNKFPYITTIIFFFQLCATNNELHFIIKESKKQVWCIKQDSHAQFKIPPNSITNKLNYKRFTSLRLKIIFCLQKFF